MLFLINDYSEGIHEKILERMIETNQAQQVGYSNDEYSKNAAELIKKAVQRDDVDVHFLVGGTQANKVALSSFLKPYEAVISPKLGHIAVHEAGAIEATGHKVIEMPSADAKLTPSQIEECLAHHVSEHMVMPKVVYISNATEMGTVYTKQELEAISATCKKHNLYLYLDGARLAVALTCEKNDMTLPDIANLCDAFYIGGTKNGALLGEALVICNDDLKTNVRYTMKQNGALMAKGRYIGLQFEAFMQDNLYLDIAKHTNEMAKVLKEGIRELGFPFAVEPDSNLIFVILPNHIHEELYKRCYYEIEGKYDDNHTTVRFVTSFVTKRSTIDDFLKLLKELS